MIKFRAKVNEIKQEGKSPLFCVFDTGGKEIPEEYIKIAREWENGAEITITEYKYQRSASANAYFHLLVHKIAEKMHIGNDECKIKMNLEYGSPKMLNEKTLFAVQVPKGAKIDDIYPYVKWVKDIEDNGVIKDVYIFYKRTHDLNTKEMSRLIEGVIHEAQQLDIETITPAEKEKLINLWEKYYEHRTKNESIKC